ncbi:peptidoglycan-binding domain-containing protein [Streptomyces sp. PA03-2a]|uniref:peptidoglycan-binding domain-containing protein n=1 Tax=Streptomyces sp. PA03-2a TaxID=3028701 RepID=UPI0029ABCEF6|nr:peptidoglycan-binding domain-containing protein [Streptomyces sp. PA03-2a]MDX2729879.1 peptidoglycan-binding domain-containing protein [Streptomyces sp. PA03-2a]
MIRRKCAAFGAALLTAGALATTTHEAAAAEKTCPYTSSIDRPALTGVSTGLSVKQAQCLSNVWGGVPKVAVDGVFGTATSKKIIWIQGCHGLGRTGVVDQATWRVLYDPALDCYDPYPK